MKFNLNYGICKCAISYLLFAVVSLCFFSPLKLLAQGGQRVVNGSFTTTIAMPNTGCSYQWTSQNSTIGLGVKGAGNILPFKAVNITANPVFDTITITSIPEHQFAYVGNSKDQTLSVVNLVDNSIVATVPINEEQWGNAVSADDSKIYISSENQSFITVFDAVHNKVDHTIPLGKPDAAATTPAAAWGMALSKDEKYLYAVNTTGGGIYSINLQTTPEQVKVIFPTLFGAFNISTGINLGDIYTLLAGDDGTKLYTNIGVYDIPTNTIVDTVGLFGAYDMIYSPDHSKIYMTTRPNVNQIGLDNVNSIRIYDVATRTYATFQIKAEAGLGNLAVSPDGNTLYADNFFYDGVSVIDLPSRSLKGTISIGNNHKGIAVGLGGTRLYVMNANGGVAIVDAKTLKVIDEIATEGKPPIGFGKFTTTGSCVNPSTFYVITVDPTPPTISASGTLPVMQTIYGTASASGSFTVSGLTVPEGILVSPPGGFEVSTDNVTYSNTLTISPDAGNVPITQIYVRLKANAPAKNYSGNVVLSSAGNAVGSVKVPVGASEVTPFPLAVSAKNVNKTYGNTLTANVDSVNFIATGLQNGDIISSVTLTYSGGGAATDVVNTYPGAVTPSAPAGTNFLASNYNITFTNSDLTVVPAPLTITVDNKSRVYADPDPVFTLTYTGFVNNEGPAQLSALPTLSTTATISSPLGQYPIIASGAAAENYSITYLQGVLTVTKRRLDLTNAFTPNGDGINDTWEIKAIGQYSNCVVQIMNRYGQQVFYSVGYGKPWDGKFKGTLLPSGTYYYVINLSQGIKPVSGFLTLIK